MKSLLYAQNSEYTFISKNFGDEVCRYVCLNNCLFYAKESAIVHVHLTVLHTISKKFITLLQTIEAKGPSINNVNKQGGGSESPNVNDTT